MKDKLVQELRQRSTMRVEGASPRLQRLLAEAANRIDLLQDLLHQRERDNDKWRKRAVTAENILRLRGML